MVRAAEQNHLPRETKPESYNPISPTREPETHLRSKSISSNDSPEFASAVLTGTQHFRDDRGGVANVAEALHVNTPTPEGYHVDNQSILARTHVPTGQGCI